jgi:hypothetical protein
MRRNMPIRRPEVVLQGAATHVAKISNGAHGVIQSVEYVIRSLDEAVAGLAQSILEARKRLAELIQRQQEITEELDLTKNQAPGYLEAEPAQDIPVATGEAELKA